MTAVDRGAEVNFMAFVVPLAADDGVVSILVTAEGVVQGVSARFAGEGAAPNAAVRSVRMLSDPSASSRSEPSLPIEFGRVVRPASWRPQSGRAARCQAALTVPAAAALLAARNSAASAWPHTRMTVEALPLAGVCGIPSLEATAGSLAAAALFEDPPAAADMLKQAALTGAEVGPLRAVLLCRGGAPVEVEVTAKLEAVIEGMRVSTTEADVDHLGDGDGAAGRLAEAAWRGLRLQIYLPWEETPRREDSQVEAGGSYRGGSQNDKRASNAASVDSDGVPHPQRGNTAIQEASLLSLQAASQARPPPLAGGGSAPRLPHADSVPELQLGVTRLRAVPEDSSDDDVAIGEGRRAAVKLAQEEALAALRRGSLPVPGPGPGHGSSGSSGGGGGGGGCPVLNQARSRMASLPTTASAGGSGGVWVDEDAALAWAQAEAMAMPALLTAAEASASIARSSAFQVSACRSDRAFAEGDSVREHPPPAAGGSVSHRQAAGGAAKAGASAAEKLARATRKKRNRKAARGLGSLSGRRSLDRLRRVVLCILLLTAAMFIVAGARNKCPAGPSFPRAPSSGIPRAALCGCPARPLTGMDLPRSRGGPALHRAGRQLRRQRPQRWRGSLPSNSLPQSFGPA